MDTTQITKALTFAERLRNNGVLILGILGSVLAALVPVLADADFTTTNGIIAVIPAVAAALGRRQAFGPVTVEKLAERRKV